MLISTGAVSVFANTTVEEQNTAQSTVTESTEDNAGLTEDKGSSSTDLIEEEKTDFPEDKPYNSNENEGSSDETKSNGTDIQMDEPEKTDGETEPAIAVCSDDSTGVTGFDQDYATYTLTLNGISLKNDESVTVAVWSEKNGQDDLRWNAPSDITSDSATVTIRISDYKSAGKYYVHCYKVTADGKYTFVKGTEFTVETAKHAKVSIVDDSYAVKGKVTLCISGIESPAGIQKVVVPTWSNANQSDIKWYNAELKDDGNYYVTFNIADHKYNWAVYSCHVYVTDHNGFMTFVGCANPDFRFMTNDISSTVSDDGSKLSASFTAERTPYGCKKVVAAVWSNTNGQDDITWNDMRQDKNTMNYSVTIPTSKLKHLGKYNVHFYAVGNDGTMHFVGGVTGNMSVTVSTATLEDAYANVEGKEQTTYTGTVTGLCSPCGISGVRAAVWSEQNGQDDLKWYTLTKKSDGSHTFTLPISNHKGIGQYNCHYYAVTNSGDYVFLSACSNVVINGAGSGTVVSAQKGDADGTFKIRIEGLTSASGISSVSVPVWTDANKQNDIVWYKAEKTSDGAWEITANIAKHSGHVGLYNIHVYATMGNGQLVFGGGTQYQCTVPENTMMFLGSTTDKTRNVAIYNTTAKSVRFAVWSAQGGQDDITWVAAQNDGSGMWSARLNSYNYWNNGTFYIHAYTGNTFLNGVSGEWNGEINRTAAYAAQILNEVGWNLRAAFNWCANLHYELGAGYPESVPAGQLHSAYYANYGFTHRTGHCYVMAATFVSMARVLGYEAYFVEGAVPYRTGGYGAHGWAEIVIGGTTYVFDPDFQYNTGRNGYQITYGASGTWKYVNYARVS